MFSSRRRKVLAVFGVASIVLALIVFLGIAEDDALELEFNPRS